MDAKALAKSKRAHSEHHSKKPQKSKAPSATATVVGNETKQLRKQTGEKSHQFRGSPNLVPSNWDRYAEELESEVLIPSLGSTIGADDIDMPKGKGVDFGYLISEAQSQLQSQSDPNLESFALFGDSLLGFNQGMSSMLSVKGNNILSWSEDDNFIVEDNDTAGYEASFLSMDLHALAAQLAKVDVSQRLFIEADLLPSELGAEGSKEIKNHESDQMETTRESERAQHYLNQLAFHGHIDEKKNMGNKSKVFMPSTRTGSDHPIPILPHQSAKLLDPPVKDDFRPLEQSDSCEILESIAQLNENVGVNSKENKPSRYEAAAAEAELDMLLDGFGESNLLGSSGITEKHHNNFPVVQLESSTSFFEGLSSGYALQQPSRQANAPTSIFLDDTIDALLEETYNSRNQKDAVQLQGEKAIPVELPSFSSHVSNSTKVLDDFDSWLDTI